MVNGEHAANLGGVLAHAVASAHGVRHLSGGNFLYKSWVFTMGAEAANVVLGAQPPIILTSRSDSDLTKLLTICASSLYSHYLQRKL